MKIRESNFELLRIIAMMMVVLLHCNYAVFGAVLLPEIEVNPIASFGRMFADQLCTPCVNVFILISGWFGINPKLKGGLSILFQVLFYTAICAILCFIMNWGVSLDKIKAALTCQQAYWFIWPYILLYITAPAFNLLVDNAPKSTVLGIVCSLLFFEFALDWVVYYAGGGGGKSYIAFVTLYIISRFIAKYGKVYRLFNYKAITYFVLFLIFSLLPTFIAFYGEQYIHFQFGKSAYTNPFVILASISLLVCFSKLTFTNSIINYFACSAFSIYLFHMNPQMTIHFKDYVYQLYCYFGAWYTPMVIVLTIVFGTLCILMDKIRVCLWNLIAK